jgi:uncharacterized membrane protein (DUF485 family)
MSINAGPKNNTATSIDYREIERSRKFTLLKRRHRRFVFPLAALFLVWYFVYVLLADYAHDFMATKAIGNITIGLLFGLGQFVTTFAITTWYVSFANRKLDPLSDEVRSDIGAER